MGALSSNRKRGDEWFVSNHENTSLTSPNFHLSKKPRLSTKQQSPDRPVLSSKSAAARVSRYPDVKPPLTRLHAPCRPTKFGPILTSSKHGLSARPSEADEREDSHESMGNNLSSRLKELKSAAFATLKYFRKENEVIELDKEVENGRVSEDSSLEEIEIIEEDEQGCKDREVGPNVIQLDTKLLDRGAQPSSSSMVSDLISSSLVNYSEGVSSLSAYKKLLEEVEKKTTRLNQLGFDIEVHERRRSWFQSMRPKKEPVEEVPREPFIPLTVEEEALVKQAFSSANRWRVLVSHENSNLEITGELLQCLRPRAWLNDEVINIYLELLKEREKREPQKFLKCHFFNTFFYKKLISGRGYDYKSVRRWTSRKKLGYDLIECDKIIVPVHKEIHWCLAVINKKEQKFQYLDSLKGRDSNVMEVLAKYYVDEVKDKNGKDINVSSWELEYVEDLPEQENGYDCGVFMIKYADFYSRGLGLYFNQEHMPYFRLRTAKEILKLRAD